MLKRQTLLDIRKFHRTCLADFAYSVCRLYYVQDGKGSGQFVDFLDFTAEKRGGVKLRLIVKKKLQLELTEAF